MFLCNTVPIYFTGSHSSKGKVDTEKFCPFNRLNVKYSMKESTTSLLLLQKQTEEKTRMNLLSLDTEAKTSNHSHHNKTQPCEADKANAHASVFQACLFCIQQFVTYSLS